MLNYHKMKYWEPNEDGIFHVAMCVYKAPDNTHPPQRDIVRRVFVETIFM